MKIADHAKPNNKPRILHFWIFTWLIASIYYGVSIKYRLYPNEADYFAYIIQMVADGFMATYTFLAYQKTKDSKSKKLFLAILISIIPGLISTESYNLLVNVIKIKSANDIINTFWTLPYFIFLVIQIPAWSYLLISNNKQESTNKKNVFTKYLYIQPALIIALFELLVSGFKEVTISQLGIISKTNTLLEFILFAVLSTCLAKTKSKPLIHIESGFLLLIALNLIHRLSYLTNHYYKSFDLVWLVCYVFIIYGLYMASKEKDFKIEFFRSDSIHNIISSTFNMFASVLFILFLTLWSLIITIQENYNHMPHIIPENISGILLALLTFSILFGKLTGEKLSKPIENVFKMVNQDEEISEKDGGFKTSKFEVYELSELEKFISKTIKELRVANRVKSEFIMNMSHDFRTPASGIYHASNSVYKKLTDPNLLKLQKLIVESSEKLVKLLDDVLDYSILENDQYEFQHNMFDIKEVISDVVSLTSAKADEKKLTVDFQLKNEPLGYFGDKVIIRSIILNIISNAIKFTTSGKISIYTRIAKVDSAGYITIEVKDTGIGIEKENHKLIFEPFTRLESAKKATHSGIGLGLSNVKLILNKLGGQITLESKLGSGSTFTVYLPINIKN